MQILETQTEQRILSISCPFGDFCYLLSGIQAITRNSGYQLVFTCSFSVNPLMRIQLLALNRIAVHLEKESTVSVMSRPRYTGAI